MPKVRKKHKQALNVIRLFLNTAELNYRERCREGNIVRLPRKGDVMIVGDLHGNMANFNNAVQMAQLERNQKRHIIFQEVIHSTNVAQEGFSTSFRVLEELAKLKCSYPDRVHMIIANHDISQACDHYIVKSGSILNMALEAGLREAYGELRAEVKKSFAQLVYSMPAAVRTRTSVFISHSLPKSKELDNFDLDVLKTPVESATIGDGSLAALVWGRDLSQEVADRFARMVRARVFVVGHTPCENGYRVANSRTLIVDTKDENGRVLILPLKLRMQNAKELVPLLKSIVYTPGV